MAKALLQQSTLVRAKCALVSSPIDFKRTTTHMRKYFVDSDMAQMQKTLLTGLSVITQTGL